VGVAGDGQGGVCVRGGIYQGLVWVVLDGSHTEVPYYCPHIPPPNPPAVQPQLPWSVVFCSAGDAYSCLLPSLPAGKGGVFRLGFCSARFQRPRNPLRRLMQMSDIARACVRVTHTERFY
jgi:hypothetical protein